VEGSPKVKVILHFKLFSYSTILSWCGFGITKSIDMYIWRPYCESYSKKKCWLGMFIVVWVEVAYLVLGYCKQFEHS
jgi:hypothetical protein